MSEFHKPSANTQSPLMGLYEINPSDHQYDILGRIVGYFAVSDITSQQDLVNLDIRITGGEVSDKKHRFRLDHVADTSTRITHINQNSGLEIFSLVETDATTELNGRKKVVWRPSRALQSELEVKTESGLGGPIEVVADSLIERGHDKLSEYDVRLVEAIGELIGQRYTDALEAFYVSLMRREIRAENPGMLTRIKQRFGR